MARNVVRIRVREILVALSDKGEQRVGVWVEDHRVAEEGEECRLEGWRGWG